MLIRRQDICVLLFYYCGYSKTRNSIFRLQRKPISRFVAFHDLPPTALKHFENNLIFLKHNTNVVSFDDFMSGRLSAEKINIVITFDDGFKSWITHAVPILQKLALPATFFISSGFIGLSKNDEDIFIQSNLLLKGKTSGSLTSDDIKKMADQGFTIGGHTLSHCILSTLRDKVKLISEIVEDKSNLERLIGKKINYFAYPSGVYYNRSMNITNELCEAGYKGAVTTIPGFNNYYTNPFLLHRELTATTMPTNIFKARVYGNYDAVQYLRNIFTSYYRTSPSNHLL